LFPHQRHVAGSISFPDKINLKELRALTLKERINQIIMLTSGLDKITVKNVYKKDIETEIIGRWNILKNAYK